MPIDQKCIRQLIPRLLIPGLLAAFPIPLTQAASETEFISPYRSNYKVWKQPSTSYALTYQEQSVYQPTARPWLNKKAKSYSPTLLASNKRSANVKPIEVKPMEKVMDTMSEKLAAQPFAKEIAQAAMAAGLDPALVHAVIFVESNYRHSAVSIKGAIGLMQVLPDTAARYGITNPGLSPRHNLKAGTLYLRDLMRMFDNRTDLALAAYNAGEGTVIRYSRKIPPYRETRHYVSAVLAKYNEIRNIPTLPNNNPRDEDLQQAMTGKPVKMEYMSGTRLAISESQFAANY